MSEIVFPHEGTIVAMYEAQGVSAENIASALMLPQPVVELILNEKSALYRSDKEIVAMVGRGPNEEDISDRMFARIRQETFQLALDRNTPIYARTGLLKYLWEKKRPAKVETTGNNITQINIALAQARETLKSKLDIG